MTPVGSVDHSSHVARLRNCCDSVFTFKTLRYTAIASGYMMGGVAFYHGAPIPGVLFATVATHFWIVSSIFIRELRQARPASQ